jgi:ribosomal protein S18 acetylase RimI-like enzyme
MAMTNRPEGGTAKAPIERRSIAARVARGTDALRQYARRFGWRAALFDLLYRQAQRLGGALVLVAVVLLPDAIDDLSLENPRGYAMGFLTAQQIERYAAQLGSTFRPTDCDEALAQGDRCYGILDGDRLISFGWYSSQPTRWDDALTIHFDPRYVYMYKGYTDPAYRGQQLHALGMAQATLAWAKEGFLGLVSVVEANNAASLHSCYRLGYKAFGRVYAARLFGAMRARANRGCRAYAFALRPRT